MAAVYLCRNRGAFGTTPQLGREVGNMRQVLVNMLLGADRQLKVAASRHKLPAGQRRR